MIKGIIFDLDGVICDTDQYHYQAWKALADELGIYFDKEINNRLRGISRMDSLEIVLEKSDKIYSYEEKEKLAEAKNETYKKLLMLMKPSDTAAEVRSTLTELKKRGFKLAIGSSSKNTKTILDRIGLRDFFDAVSDGTNIVRSKPDPEVFIKAAEYLNEKPQECLVVEDAEAGIEAAYRGNFYSAGVKDAKRHPCVTYKLEQFSDLLKIARGPGQQI